MKKILLISVTFFISFLCAGQNSSAPYRQFYFNPYLFNPAYAGINGYTEVYLSYRKQWLNVTDAPVVSGLSLQYATQKRVSLGLNIITQDVVALRSTSAMATFVYSLPLGTDQSLRFGLSGGLGSNQLHLEEGEYDPNDPTIQNAMANNIYADGNFGAVYVNKGLRIGFALPRLFGQKVVSPQELGTTKFSQLKNQLYSISYKFNIVPGSLSLEPYFIYRATRDNQNSWEASSILYIKEKIWTGVSYHETNGLAFFLGLDIKDRFRFGYSYELPPVSSDFVSTNSHEIHLNIRIGKKKGPKAKEETKPVENLVKTDSAKTEKPKEPIAQEEPAKEPVVTDQPVTPAVAIAIVPVITQQKEEPAVVQEKPTADNAKEAVVPVKKAESPPRSFAMAKGHYVTVGVFRIMENASNYLMGLDRKGIKDASVALNPKNNYYYVYIFSTYDIEEARKVRNQYRLKRPFSEAWVFTME